MGNTSRATRFEDIGEYRIDWGPSNWIYLARDEGCLIVLFGGGTKRRQQADIDRAKVLRLALTRDFKQTVVERVQRDPAFARALLDEAASLFLNGEPETARLILRDLVNATIGFEALAEMIDKPSKSLHRMLSPKGNPSWTTWRPSSARYAASSKWGSRFTASKQLDLQTAGGGKRAGSKHDPLCRTGNHPS